MPYPPFEQVLGTVGRHSVQARTASGAIVPFLSTDPLEAIAWAGDDRATSFNPTVEWEDAPAGVFTLTIVSAMTAGLDAGQYRLQAFVTPPSDGQKRCLFDGSVRFLPTAGVAAQAKVYASYEDLCDYCPRIVSIQDDLSDQAGFAEQRARARTWLDEEILRYYHPVPGRARRMVDANVSGAGQYVAFADPPEGAIVPSDAGLKAMLDANGLMVTDILKEAVSHKAAAIAYRSSVGTYDREAVQHESAAQRGWYRAVIEVKSDPELDAPDMRIGRDVTFLT